MDKFQHSIHFSDNNFFNNLSASCDKTKDLFPTSPTDEQEGGRRSPDTRKMGIQEADTPISLDESAKGLLEQSNQFLDRAFEQGMLDEASADNWAQTIQNRLYRPHTLFEEVFKQVVKKQKFEQIADLLSGLPEYEKFYGECIGPIVYQEGEGAASRNDSYPKEKDLIQRDLKKMSLDELLEEADSLLPLTTQLGFAARFKSIAAQGEITENDLSQPSMLDPLAIDLRHALSEALAHQQNIYQCLSGIKPKYEVVRLFLKEQESLRSVAAYEGNPFREPGRFYDNVIRDDVIECAPLELYQEIKMSRNRFNKILRNPEKYSKKIQEIQGQMRELTDQITNPGKKSEDALKDLYTKCANKLKEYEKAVQELNEKCADFAKAYDEIYKSLEERIIVPIESKANTMAYLSYIGLTNLECSIISYLDKQWYNKIDNIDKNIIKANRCNYGIFNYKCEHTAQDNPVLVLDCLRLYHLSRENTHYARQRALRSFEEGAEFHQFKKLRARHYALAEESAEYLYSSFEEQHLQYNKEDNRDVKLIKELMKKRIMARKARRDAEKARGTDQFGPLRLKANQLARIAQKESTDTEDQLGNSLFNELLLKLEKPFRHIREAETVFRDSDEHIPTPGKNGKLLLPLMEDHVTDLGRVIRCLETTNMRTRERDDKYYKDLTSGANIFNKSIFRDKICVRICRAEKLPYANCHGMTFTNGEGGDIPGNDVMDILKDNGYKEILAGDVCLGNDDINSQQKNPQVGDIIVYFDKKGGVVHSGIVACILEDPQKTCVLSKWGGQGFYFHEVAAVPYNYGPNYKIYRSERKRGRLLRKRYF